MNGNVKEQTDRKPSRAEQSGSPMYDIRDIVPDDCVVCLELRQDMIGPVADALTQATDCGKPKSRHSLSHALYAALAVCKRQKTLAEVRAEATDQGFEHMLPNAVVVDSDGNPETAEEVATAVA